MSVYSLINLAGCGAGRYGQQKPAVTSSPQADEEFGRFSLHHMLRKVSVGASARPRHAHPTLRLLHLLVSAALLAPPTGHARSQCNELAAANRTARSLRVPPTSRRASLWGGRPSWGG